MKLPTIIIYTDGSSRGNPGPGGWGVIVATEERVTEYGGGNLYTTNNKMELEAAIAALVVARDLGDALSVDMRIDSKYVISGITNWVFGWQKNGWMNSKKEEVLNRDLWEKLARVASDVKGNGGTIIWRYTPGHVGIPGNERADEIATMFADGKSIKLFDGARNSYKFDLAIYTGEEKKIAAKKLKSKSKSTAKVYSYVSLVDGKFVKHASWTECEKRVKGTKGAKFKKTFNAGDEVRIAKEWGV